MKAALSTLVLLTVLAAMLVMTLPAGASHVTQPNCGNYQNTSRYVGMPVFEPEGSGRVVHNLNDIYGGTYATGSYVVGWQVRLGGREIPRAERFTYKSGSSITIQPGQSAKACIAQKAPQGDGWSGQPPYWYVLSPAVHRR